MAEKKDIVETTQDEADEMLIRTIVPVKLNTAASAVREADLEDPKKMITMSNNFIVGIEEGSRLAHKISRIAVAQLSYQDTDMPLTKITSENIEQMGLTRERLTSHSASVLDEILSLRIKISEFGTINNAERMTAINVFSFASYNRREGGITVQLNPILKEHFLHLTQDYTQYEMQVAIKMNSTAASHLHELLIARSRQFGAHIIEFKIEQLAALLGYTQKNKEKPFSPSDFANSTLKRSVKTINEVSECKVDYVLVKTGKKITSVRFYVEADWKTVKEKEEAEKRVEEMRQDNTLAAILNESEEKTIFALENGQMSIFPEEIIMSKTEKRSTELKEKEGTL